MKPPTWFDWITVTALLLGPIVALLTQRLLDLLREKKKERLNLYLTIMSNRAVWLHPDSVKAHNLIDTIFCRKKDEPIRDAWAAIIAHANTERPKAEDRAKAWDDRVYDLRVDLMQRLGVAVGYEHTVDYIKRQIYLPSLHVDTEMEFMQMRKQFLKVITDDGLKVLVAEPPSAPPTMVPFGTAHPRR
jgi:hypothetical protein